MQRMPPPTFHTFASELRLTRTEVLYKRQVENCFNYSEWLKCVEKLKSLSQDSLNNLLSCADGRPGLVNLLSTGTGGDDQHLVLQDLLKPPFSASLDARSFAHWICLSADSVAVAVQAGGASPTTLLLRLMWRRDLGAGLFNIVRVLVEHGADLDARDDSGWTALHLACHHGHQAISEYLVVPGGANPHLRTPAGETALDLAPNPHFRETVASLDPPVPVALKLLRKIVKSTGLIPDLANLVLRDLIRHRYPSSAMQGEPSLVFLYHRLQREKPGRTLAGKRRHSELL